MNFLKWRENFWTFTRSNKELLMLRQCAWVPSWTVLQLLYPIPIFICELFMGMSKHFLRQFCWMWFCMSAFESTLNQASRAAIMHLIAHNWPPTTGSRITLLMNHMYFSSSLSKRMLSCSALGVEGDSKTFKPIFTSLIFYDGCWMLSVISMRETRACIYYK